MWYHFLHQGKSLCQNPFSHLGPGFKYQRYRYPFLSAVLYLPALTLHPLRCLSQLGLRGRNQSHSSASAMDRRGVLFFNLVTQDALGCWDSSKPYGRATVGHVSQDHQLLNFPNDLKVDREEPQNIWLLSNRLHIYLYRSLSPDVSVLTEKPEPRIWGNSTQKPRVKKNIFGVHFDTYTKMIRKRRNEVLNRSQNVL